jgi:endonuclease-3
LPMNRSSKPDFPIDKAVRIIKEQVREWRAAGYDGPPVKGDPFRVLIACIISLRTKDEVTAESAGRLFARADTPGAMLKLRANTIAKLIYPAGFYNTKGKTIREICRRLIEDYGGEVPDELDELLKFKGVGRKTANLVIGEGFGKPAICVDTHVHRITNRWGYVKTKTPDQTEMVLREILPKKHWIPINSLLVTYGQKLCKPISPLCSQCKMESYCPRIGVERSR